MHGEALGKMGEEAATNEVISKLVSALGDQELAFSGNAMHVKLSQRWVKKERRMK